MQHILKPEKRILTVPVEKQKDGDPDTHCPEMDYDALEATITEKTEAIVPVNLGCIVCDYDRIYEAVEQKKDCLSRWGATVLRYQSFLRPFSAVMVA